jgi:hypothetical protein
MEVLVKKLLIAAAAALALATVATTASAQHSRASHDGGSWSGGGSSSRGGNWHGGGDWRGGGNWGGWHGSRIGFSFGFPGFYYWGPGYYPYAYAYPYPYGYYDGGYYDGYSSYDAAPQTYIQRDTGDAIAPAAPQRSQYSYYCTNPAGYYPQIANCPTGWLTVVPNGAPRAAPAPR